MKIKTLTLVVLTVTCSLLHAQSVDVYVAYSAGVPPTPWNGSPNTTFVGVSDNDSGAIRIDNNTVNPITIDSVNVSFPWWSPALINLWGTNVLQPGNRLILTATGGYNFDTSDSGGGGGPFPDGETAHAPQVDISINGSVTTYLDTGHILTTGGTDGDQNLQWRKISTTGVSDPVGDASGVGIVITAQATNQVVPIGGDGSFSISVTSTNPVTYQWKHNGVDISGATDSSLAVTNAQLADSGSYYVELNNGVGSFTSESAQLGVDVGPGTGTGLTGTYYRRNDFTGDRTTQVDATVDFNLTADANEAGSIRWIGQVQPRFSETYTFSLNADDHVTLWVNGAVIASGGYSIASGSIALSAGQKYDIRLDYSDDYINPDYIHLYWSSTSQAQEIIPQAQLYPTDSANTSNGLVAYYPFSGDANDASGNGNDGTLVNATIGDGYTGTGLNTTNNPSSYVSVPHSSSLNVSNAVTISAWVKPETAPLADGSFSFILAQEADEPGFPVYELAVTYSHDHLLFLAKLQDDSLPGITFRSMPLGQFSHVAATFDAANNQMNVYLNGSLVGSVSCPGLPLKMTGNSLNIGKGFGGIIDEVRIYNRAITPNEVVALSAEPGTLPPVITQSPDDRTVFQNQPSTFTVLVDGSPTLAYQWRFNGGDISGATLASYLLASAQFTNAGSYDVVVSNAYGSVTNSPALLTVHTNAPTIVVNPQSVTTTAGSTVIFTVTATDPMTYRWRNNGVNIPGANAATYTLSNVQKADAGPNKYDVIIGNDTGSTPSGAASLAVTYTSPFEVAQGTYNGLFSYNYYYYYYYYGNTYFGKFTLSLTKKGKYTVKLVTDGDTISFSGSFPTNTTHPTLTTNVSRAKFGKSPLSVNMALDFEYWPEAVTGYVYNPDSYYLNLTANREAFSATNLATQYASNYTLAFPFSRYSGPDGPAGYGFATLKVNTKGKAALVGTLADGQPFSQSLGLAKDGSWPFYTQLYKTTTNYFDNSKNPPVAKVNHSYTVGSAGGWESLAGGIPTGYYGWAKGVTPVGAYLYPSGFSGGYSVLGSVYVKPPAATASLTKTNGQLYIYGGDITSSIPWPYNTTLKPNNQFVIAPTNNLPKLSITKASGLVTGSFRHPDIGSTKPTKFKGIVLQNQNYVYGFFLGTDQAGAFYVQEY